MCPRGPNLAGRTVGTLTLVSGGWIGAAGTGDRSGHITRHVGPLQRPPLFRGGAFFVAVPATFAYTHPKREGVPPVSFKCGRSGKGSFWRVGI